MGSSKKPAGCQGQAAFGGCFANLDSLPSFCKGLEAAGLGVDMRKMYALSILPPSARPQGREHGSQDKLPNIRILCRQFFSPFKKSLDDIPIM